MQKSSRDIDVQTVMLLVRLELYLSNVYCCTEATASELQDNIKGKFTE